MKLECQQYRQMIESFIDGILVALPQTGEIVYANPAIKYLLGYSPDELIGQELDSLYFQKENKETQRKKYLLQNRNYDNILIEDFSHADGSAIILDTTFTPVNWQDDMAILITLRKIQERIDFELQREHLIYRDSLTNIPNRRAFDSHLSQLLRRASRAVAPLSILMMDIDYFKQYNDYYGHMEGDNCLRTIAHALQSFPRRIDDMMARYGGEEFIAVLYGPDQKKAIELANRIREKIEDLKIPHERSNVSEWVTVSIGVSTIFSYTSGVAQEVICSADKALYHAKSAGRNQVFYQDMMDITGDCT